MATVNVEVLLGLLGTVFAAAQCALAVSEQLEKSKKKRKKGSKKKRKK